MIIRNVNQAGLTSALHLTNRVFGNNIEFFVAEPAGRTRQGGEKWHVRLTVVSSRGPGARRSSDGSGRRVKAACWHVHGTFFDSLPPEAEILIAGEEGVHRPGDEWQDRNIGSLANPMMHSEACDCDGPFKPFILPGKKEWRPD